jgi:hypothetical protein
MIQLSRNIKETSGMYYVSQFLILNIILFYISSKHVDTFFFVYLSSRV